MVTAERTREFRARCLRCRKPSSMCYCALLPRLETKTRVVILQHRRERDMPIGTARMATLCLPQAELHVGVDWNNSEPLAEALSDPARPPVLLYPGPDARDILREPPPGPVTLVVVDGTWSQARTVVRDNPLLNALPRYAFAAPEPSRYRIRREPRAEYCSTIEALMHVLGVLEGDPTKFRALLVPFEAMIDAQLACEASSPAQRCRYASTRPKRPNLPETIASRWDDLLCVVGEANAWPYQAGAPTRPSELVHWLAYRPSDGSLFDAISAPRGPLSPSTTFHSELSEAQIAAGMPADTLIDQFAAFVRPNALVCVWGNYAPSLLRDRADVLPAERLDLRQVAGRYTQGKVGGLDKYAGDDVTPLAAGRGGRRLAMLAKLLRTWRDALEAAR
ncbi:MAG TPA: tRNA-uridine aminocarboxypropyltransferase [Kofleriaceae bacterium]|nr:tRNA-uridine aminocarboxypropyltransferase [Kofleriaceae bacterium]